ncbi:MAG TPA: hypothetical protein VHK65_18275 [Candidatus Dormibacteraeota bacterium]|nr:hypothetical protein [Candidatus Dormibacteraeota bacterium]
MVAVPVAVLCLIALGLLTLFDGDLVSYVRVTHQAESELSYPGAILVRNRAMGSHTDAFFGTYYPAFTSSILRTDASADTIREWYRMRLTTDGWTDEGDGTSYNRPGQHIRLFFFVGHSFYGYAFGFDCGGHNNCDTQFPPA